MRRGFKGTSGEVVTNVKPEWLHTHKKLKMSEMKRCKQKLRNMLEQSEKPREVRRVQKKLDTGVSSG